MFVCPRWESVILTAHFIGATSEICLFQCGNTGQSAHWTGERDMANRMISPKVSIAEPPRKLGDFALSCLCPPEKTVNLSSCQQKHSSSSVDATFRHLIANFLLVSFELRQKVLCVDCLGQSGGELDTQKANPCFQPFLIWNTTHFTRDWNSWHFYHICTEE